MSFLKSRKSDLLVVSVTCGSNHGTAFFVNEKQLLTARHVVRDAFSDSMESVIIDIAGMSIRCNVVEQPADMADRRDVALLTILDEEPYTSEDSLSLLSDKFIKDLNLQIVGFPRELALSVRQVAFHVQNRLVIDDFNDRAVVVLDKLRLVSYEGLSGSPVVNREGKVVGITTIQDGSSLGYLSINKIEDILSSFGLEYGKDWSSEDDTLLGLGRSNDLCKQAVETMHDRYMPKLHQTNTKLESFLERIVNRKTLTKHYQKINRLLSFILSLPVSKKELLCKKGVNIAKVDEDYFSNESFSELKYAFHKLHDSNFQSAISSSISAHIELVNILNDFDEDSFAWADGDHIKFLCLTGKAGSGKTHSLCDFSLHASLHSNVYLFFGTEFQNHISPIEYISDRICSDVSMEDFNAGLKEANSNAVIIIDALNEGVGCSYWNHHLGGLRNKISQLSNFKLIISVRSPFENEINDLSQKYRGDKSYWHPYEIKGFEDREKAIEDYFKEYDIPKETKENRIAEFVNPLFLKAFCEVFHTLSPEEKKHISKRVLYKKYVRKKNAQVSKFAEEDPELNIADIYLSKLANYSVFYGDFNTISRDKARYYAKRLCPGRTWKHDLLNACLTENLLLDDKSGGDVPAVMFEYENLGDYYKAEQLRMSKMGMGRMLGWVSDALSSMERRSIYPNPNFDNAIRALFDSLLEEKIDITSCPEVRSKGKLYNLFVESLMDSKLKEAVFRNVMISLDDGDNHPLTLVNDFDNKTLADVLQIHDRLKNMQCVGKRDVIWTQYVNGLYNMYGGQFVGEQPIEQDPSLPLCDDEKKYLVSLVWMLSSSHPKFRAIIVRKLFVMLQIRTELIFWLIDLFCDVNDPYVLEGLYRAICGVVLSSRNKETVLPLATRIFNLYYSEEGKAPADLLIRQWTLKIVERASYLCAECKYWENVIVSSGQDLPKGHLELDDVTESYFGYQLGSKRIYRSIFDFEDFNRYVIGENSHNKSSDYFVLNDEEVYVGYNLKDLEKDLAYEIIHTFGWNDRLGSFDNRTYSSNRHHNDTERLGKKFQWLAWYRVNALLMDKCRVSKDRFFYKDKAVPEDLEAKPYPWHTSASSYFDPTLSPKLYRTNRIMLRGTEPKPSNGLAEPDWVDNNTILPDFRYIAQDESGVKYIMLMCYDTCKSEGKETFLFTNAAFVKDTDKKGFQNWASNKNFYGRWMPERRGSIDFLWSDYPWADAYLSSLEGNSWEEPHEGCPCEVLLSYEAQLQEDWEGIDADDEYVTTAYMPCVEMMQYLKLYNSDIRGVVRCVADDSIASLSIETKDGVTGLFIRKDLLDKFISEKKYALYYYTLGEKVSKLGDNHSAMRDLSAAYMYNTDGSITEIQPLRVIPREIPQPVTEDRIAELKAKKGLTTREMIDLATAKKRQELKTEANLDDDDSADDTDSSNNE